MRPTVMLGELGPISTEEICELAQGELSEIWKVHGVDLPRALNGHVRLRHRAAVEGGEEPPAQRARMREKGRIGWPLRHVKGDKNLGGRMDDERIDGGSLSGGQRRAEAYTGLLNHTQRHGADHGGAAESTPIEYFHSAPMWPMLVL
jgi:hypothetical protein